MTQHLLSVLLLWHPISWTRSPKVKMRAKELGKMEALLLLLRTPTPVNEALTHHPITSSKFHLSTLSALRIKCTGWERGREFEEYSQTTARNVKEKKLNCHLNKQTKPTSFFFILFLQKPDPQDIASNRI